MNRPVLSVCLIVGDAHIPVLARCLRSILNRPEGPAASEVVIGFNGKDTSGFTDVLRNALLNDWGLLESDYHTALKTGEPITCGPVQLVLHEYAWKADFADARNDNFSRATGEWVMYVDCDDILADANHPAFADSMEQDPPPSAVETYPVKGTLVDFFRSLPPHVNVVQAPYNYVNSDTGRPVIRKRRPRAVRWAEGHFCWTSEVHEVLVSALGREVPVWAPGLLLVHEPIITPEVRDERNVAILDEQEARLAREGVALPGIVVYAQAQDLLGARNFAAAADAFEKAAMSPDTGTEDRTLFFSMAARAAMEDGDFNRAGKYSLTVIDLSPMRPEGYLLASEACFRLYQFDRCIAWYEASKGKRPPEGGPMMDDRFERCLRPVAFVGMAYLRVSRFQDALTVAELALREATDIFALKVKQEAEEGLKRQAVAESGTKLADALLALGFAKTARRVLAAVEGFGEFRKQHRDVEARLAADVAAFPEHSIVKPWLEEALPGGMLGLSAPLDSAEEPSEIVAAMDQAAAARNAESLRVATTDPWGGDSFATANRVDTIVPEKLAKILDPFGAIDQLSLVEDTTGRYVVAEVKRKKNAAPRTPDITLFCPVFAEPWGPWRILKDGTGGSEESVIYLARELQSRGFNVDVYAALDAKRHRGLHVEGGVYWRHLDAFDSTKRVKGIAIAQRAPWAVRIPAFDPKRLYIWHQDADYHFGWNTAVAATVKHLFVSKWQRARLLAQASAACRDNEVLFDSFGAVVGNGIPQSALDVPFPETRDPFSCVYISSPVRGLTPLLELWPQVRASFPEATLRVYYGWETARVFPGISKVQEATTRLVRKTPGVEWVGRLAQHDLEQDLVKRSVWAYPCVVGETKIAMPCDHRKYPDGVPISELVGRSNFPVWSFDEKVCEFTLGTATKVWKTKDVSELLEVDLDDGSTLRLTPEHRLMDFDGKWKEAQDFAAGERLMALHYRYDVMVKDADGRWEPESRAVGAWLEGRELSSKEHVDHDDATRLDNSPERLHVLTASEHAKKTFSGAVHTKRRTEKTKAGARRRWTRELSTVKGRAKVSKAHSAQSKAFWASMSPKEREIFLAARKEKQREGFAKMSPEARTRMEHGATRGRDGRWAAHKRAGKNHRIVAIRRVTLDVPVPVYDMTVDKFHNFIANGVVAHNCLFPEGFCNAGIRATAAGLVPVYRGTAAMPEVQFPSPYASPDVDWTHDGVDHGKRLFTEGLLAALQDAKDGKVDRQVLRDWAARSWTWDRVATAVIAEFERSGMLGGKAAA